MSTPTPDPAITPQSALINVWQAVIALLGVLGYSVPPILTNLAVEQQIVGIGLSLIGIGSMLYSHFRKTATIKTLSTRLTATSKGR